MHTRSSFLSSVSYCCLPVLCFLAIGSLGQAENIAQQARAERELLAKAIAALDAATFNAKLAETAGNSDLSNWYTGKVLINDQWLTIEQAEAHLSADEKAMRYRRLRQQALDNLPSHEKLARWCSKNDLSEIARVHWLHVLRFEPNHSVALDQLGLRWHDGRLLTYDEAKLAEKRMREYKKQQKKWRAKAKVLRRELELGEPEQQQVARKQLREIKEPTAVQALIDEFHEPAQTEEKTARRRSELLSALANIESAGATEMIISYAVNSSDKNLRYEAIDLLKSKPYEDYVPILISHMQMPIEASVSINQIGNNIVNNYSYLQETPSGYDEQNYQTSQRIPGNPYISADIYRTRTIRDSYVQPAVHREAYMCGGHMVPAVNRPARVVTREYKIAEYVDTKYGENPTYRAKRKDTLSRSQQQARAINTQLEIINNTRNKQNDRIAAVLTEVTGETLEAFPKSWWNWWGDYLDKHPGIANVGVRRRFSSTLLNREPRGLSLGTLVWTSQGKQPIERILPGDFVLSQDLRSGELAYKPVLAIAQPQRMPVTKIDLDDSELHCAPGHVLWVTGMGWQRVSKLSSDHLLHGATAESRVTQVEEAFAIESRDLIIEDFHTFFVGQRGLLVHDATPIAPAYVGLPGFSPATLSQAAQLAANDP